MRETTQDTLDKITAVTGLNLRGFELVEKASNLPKEEQTPLLEEALDMHRRAEDFAEDNELPVHFAIVSRYYTSYAKRRLAYNFDELVRFNDVNLEMARIARSPFAEGCALEELALTCRYRPGFTSQDLRTGIGHIEGAVSAFERAWEARSRGWEPNADVMNRLLRSYGVSSTIYVELSKKDDVSEEEKHDVLTKAVMRAYKELTTRVENGEAAGGALLNAHHTVLVNLSRLAGKDPVYYLAGLQHLAQARRLALELDRKLEHSLLYAREAYLHLQSRRAEPGKITAALDAFLANEAHITRPVLAAIEPDLRQLAYEVGGPQGEGITELLGRRLAPQ